MSYLEAAFSRTVAFLPDLIAGLIILAIGWLIAAVVRRVIFAALPRLGFDRFLVRHGLIQTPVTTEGHDDAGQGTRAVGAVVFWGILLIALMEAAQVWHLPFLAVGIARVLGFVPNAVVAVIIFAVALVAGNWAERRLRETRADDAQAALQPQSRIVPGAVRGGILTVGAFLALRELAIAPEILIIGFTLVFGAIALAAALAFGLGGRRAAEKVTDDWYESQRARQARNEASRNTLRTTQPLGTDLH
jgi:hypothetical protein